MPYLIAKILFFLGAAGLLGFLIAWWWTRHTERRRSVELEGVWTQKVQRANRELDALRADLRTEATRTQSASDEEQNLQEKVKAAEAERNSLQEKVNELTASLVVALEKSKPAVDPALGQRVAALEGELAAKAASAAAAEGELVEIRSKVAERDAAISALQAKLGELESLPQQLQEAEAKRKAAEDSLQAGISSQAAGTAKTAKLEARLAELEAAQAAVAGDRDAKRKEWESRYQSLLKEKDGALARLLAQIGELEPLKRKVPELEKQLAQKAASGDAAMKAAEARYQGMLKEKDVSLARLLGQVADLEPLKGKVSDLQNQFAETTQESAELRQELEARDARLQQLEALLASAQAAPKKATSKAAKVEDPNAPDDLKKIRGIGPVLQKRLTGIGVVSFEQIAKWTSADMEQYQRLLPEFKDRMRRDNWIECAREEFQKKYGQAI